MTPFDEKRLRDYYATWSAGEPARAMEFFAAGAIFEDLAFNTKFEGLEAIRSFVDLTYQGIPDFRVVPQQTVVDGSHAVATTETDAPDMTSPIFWFLLSVPGHSRIVPKSPYGVMCRSPHLSSAMSETRAIRSRITKSDIQLHFSPPHDELGRGADYALTLPPK